MHTIEKFLTVVERMNTWIGKASCNLIFVFMLLMVYEVIARYFFESPTIWVHEVCGYVFAAYIALTGAWVLNEKGHVAVDIIYQHFPGRLKQAADILISLVALVMFVVLFWQGYKFAWHAFTTGQHSHTLFGPPLWPVKSMLPAGAFFFILQIAADLIRSILTLEKKEAH